MKIVDDKLWKVMLEDHIHHKSYCILHSGKLLDSEELSPPYRFHCAGPIASDMAFACAGLVDLPLQSAQSVH